MDAPTAGGRLLQLAAVCNFNCSLLPNAWALAIGRTSSDRRLLTGLGRL